MQKTFIFIKPDVFTRNLQKQLGEQIRTFAQAYDLEIECEYEGQMTKPFLQYHYAVHLDKPFYDELVESYINEPFHAYVLVGEKAIDKVLNNLKPNVRAKYAIDKIENSLHSADAQVTAKYEISNFMRFYS